MAFYGMNVVVLVTETVTGGLEHEVSPEAMMYQTLIKRNLRDAFPDVEVLLRLCFTLISSNYDRERYLQVETDEGCALIHNELEQVSSSDYAEYGMGYHASD